MSDPFNDNDDEKVDVLALDEAKRTHKVLCGGERGYDGDVAATLVIAVAVFQTNALLMDLEVQLKRIADAVQAMEDRRG